MNSTRKFAVSFNTSLIRTFLGLITGTPIALFFGAIPAIQTGEVDIIKIMASYGLVIPAIVLLFVSTWMANTLNLYSVQPLHFLPQNHNGAIRR